MEKRIVGSGEYSQWGGKGVNKVWGSGSRESGVGYLQLLRRGCMHYAPSGEGQKCSNRIFLDLLVSMMR